MNPNNYQVSAITTALPNARKLEYLVPGLAGEFGEIQEVILCSQYKGWDEELDNFSAECADTMWFLALIADFFAWDFDDIILEESRTLEEYEDLVRHSVEVEKADLDILVYELGLYIGQLSSIYAKAVRDDNGEFSEARLRKMQLALSNVAFSVSRLAIYGNVTLSDLLEQNIAKLLDRKERGVLGGSGNKR